MSKLIRDVFLALVLSVGLSAAALAQPQAPAPQLRGFPQLPEAAADAVTEAIRNNDDKALTAILGATWHEFAPAPTAMTTRSAPAYLKAWDEKHAIIPEGPDKVLYGAGTTGWVAPIPIVKQGNEWRFDVETGKGDAGAPDRPQRAGRRADHAGDRRRPARRRRVRSHEGGASGLCPAAAEQCRPQGRALLGEQPGEPESPLGPLIAKAQPGEIQLNGYYGYRFRLLYSQGPEAPGGAYDYLVNGRMLGGFAVIAWPVRWDETGVMTFIVSRNSDVYEKDLGPDTAQAAAAINAFNPDSRGKRPT